MRESDSEDKVRSQVDRVRLSRQRHLTARSLRCAVYKCGPNPVGVKIKGLGGVKPNFQIDFPKGRSIFLLIAKFQLAGAGSQRRFFHYTIVPATCQANSAENFIQKIIPKFVYFAYCILQGHVLYYNHRER